MSNEISLDVIFADVIKKLLSDLFIKNDVKFT